MDNVDSEISGEDGEESVEEPRGGDGAQEDEPEVEEDVDLLVDDVDGQDAQRVVGLDGAGRSVLVEPTLEGKKIHKYNETCANIDQKSRLLLVISVESLITV